MGKAPSVTVTDGDRLKVPGPEAQQKRAASAHPQTFSRRQSLLSLVAPHLCFTSTFFLFSSPSLRPGNLSLLFCFPLSIAFLFLSLTLHHVCLFSAETADPQGSPQSPVPHRFSLPHFVFPVLRPQLLQSFFVSCSPPRLQILNHGVPAIGGSNPSYGREGL